MNQLRSKIFRSVSDGIKEVRKLASFFVPAYAEARGHVADKAMGLLCRKSIHAAVAKLVDALRSGRSEGNLMGVQVSPAAQKSKALFQNCALHRFVVGNGVRYN